MFEKILKLLGFRYCILCGKQKFRGKKLRWTDDGETIYRAFTCRYCAGHYREE